MRLHQQILKNLKDKGFDLAGLPMRLCNEVVYQNEFVTVKMNKMVSGLVIGKMGHLMPTELQSHFLIADRGSAAENFHRWVEFFGCVDDAVDGKT